MEGSRTKDVYDSLNTFQYAINCISFKKICYRNSIKEKKKMNHPGSVKQTNSRRVKLVLLSIKFQFENIN